MPDQPFTSAASATAAARLTRVRAWVRWHRRPVAAALAVLGLALLVREIRPPPAATVTVVAAARDLASGTSVSADDVSVIQVPAASAPERALRSSPTGRVVALPVARGEILTDLRVLGDGLLSVLGADAGAERVAVPVHLADSAAASVVRVGDTVDVIGAGAAGTASVAARGALVLVTPPGRQATAFGGTTSTPGGDGVLVLAVTGTEALALARSAAIDRLSVVVRAAPSTAVR